MQRVFTVSKLVPFVSSTTNTMNNVPNAQMPENSHMHPYNPIDSVKIGNVFNIRNDITLMDATHKVEPIPRICK